MKPVTVGSFNPEEPKDMEDLVLERRVVELLLVAKHVKKVKIINGHVTGNITKAIRGEKVGTLIRTSS